MHWKQSTSRSYRSLTLDSPKEFSTGTRLLLEWHFPEVTFGRLYQLFLMPYGFENVRRHLRDPERRQEVGSM